MSRPLRIEFPGAVHHMTVRGDRRGSLFAENEARVALLGIVEQGIDPVRAALVDDPAAW